MTPTLKTIKLTWDIIIIISIIIITFFIPLEIIYKTKLTQIFDNYYWIFSLIYMIDLIFCIIQKDRYSKNIYSDSKKSEHKYYKTWFIVDFIAALPLEFLFGWKVLRIFRLVKIAKVVHISNNFSKDVFRYSTLIKITIFSYCFITFIHFSSIVWTLISGVNPLVNNATNYIQSIFWTITTITSFGNVDINTNSNSQMMYSIFIMLIGIAIFAIIIAYIVNYFYRKHINRNNYRQNIRRLHFIAKNRQIPQELVKRIEDFYKYKFEIQKDFNETQFLESLPAALKNETSLFLMKTSIEKMPLFRDTDEDFINELALELRPILLTPGDFVFKAGEFGDEMFFVLSGELDVFTKKDNFYLTTLKKGDFFGEIALFYDKPRTASIHAITFCEIYSLHKEEFNSVMAKYPKISKQIKLKIDKFLQSTS
ncbi:MAG: cyclic nucleotide-binding domain-containing protein [Ignavibacteriales bacterium]|nr:cyclic nucleotide-binding domain-containing protein [Ignavibacteriales bacterium]